MVMPWTQSNNGGGFTQGYTKLVVLWRTSNRKAGRERRKKGKKVDLILGSKVVRYGRSEQEKERKGEGWVERVNNDLLTSDGWLTMPCSLLKYTREGEEREIE